MFFQTLRITICAEAALAARSMDPFAWYTMSGRPLPSGSVSEVVLSNQTGPARSLMLPVEPGEAACPPAMVRAVQVAPRSFDQKRSEEHTSELQSRVDLV